MKHIESTEQIALFKWIDLSLNKYPQLKLISASMNAAKRSVIQASLMKKSGLRAGVPDIFLAYPSGIYHGLFIEMKSKSTLITKTGKTSVKRGRFSESQIRWIDNLREVGYAVDVCYTWLEAKDTILSYLNVKCLN